jgi:hypothetical protein
MDGYLAHYGRIDDGQGSSILMLFSDLAYRIDFFLGTKIMCVKRKRDGKSAGRKEIEKKKEN